MCMRSTTEILTGLRQLGGPMSVETIVEEALSQVHSEVRVEMWAGCCHPIGSALFLPLHP